VEGDSTHSLVEHTDGGFEHREKVEKVKAIGTVVILVEIIEWWAMNLWMKG